MPSTTLIALSTIAALVSVAVYLPMQRTTKLFEGATSIQNFGMEKCQRISGPSFCDDVRIQRNLNIGLAACDESLPYRNFAASVFDESKMKENGALWLYDLNKPGSPAEKLTIKNFDGPFHPSGVTFAPTSADGTPARVVVLVVNHVPLETPRVEVLYYYPARKSLVYKKTISSTNFFAANKISASPVDTHQQDDTPSFFVTNDHGYNITDWKREYEEKYNLPASSMVYYNARADMAQEVSWRLQMPTGLVAGDKENSIWVAQAKAGTVDHYQAHMLSAEHQEQKVLSVDTHEPITIGWPGMMNEEVMNTKLFNVGIDYDPKANTLVTVSHTRWNDYVQHAKERLEDKDTTPSTKAGFLVSKAFQYPVRVGETRPKPQKHIVIDPEQRPRRYRLQYFFEPVISNDGSDFGTPSAIAASGDRILITGAYEKGFLDCNLA
ncbi:hypothetical protein BG006_010586 [Podila minutissima]|uniref:Serum paraoxonase/arylesterase n=1 Tax=Podila minutissima TaxID=64525 RepID=A0A9P5SFL2_9FUNG|nr:hypothetical protein BG006_010586 [Podila minutissima]